MVRGHGAEAVVVPAGRVVADIGADVLKLAARGDQVVVIARQPEAGADIRAQPCPSGAVVQMRGKALKPLHQVRQVVRFVCRARVDADHGMEVIGHHDERIAPRLGVTREQPLPAAHDLQPQRIQFAPAVRDDAEHRLVLRHLHGGEEPAVRVVDVGVAERIGHDAVSSCGSDARSFDQLARHLSDCFR